MILISFKVGWGWKLDSRFTATKCLQPANASMHYHSQIWRRKKKPEELCETYSSNHICPIRNPNCRNKEQYDANLLSNFHLIQIKVGITTLQKVLGEYANQFLCSLSLFSLPNVEKLTLSWPRRPTSNWVKWDKIGLTSLDFLDMSPTKQVWLEHVLFQLF